MEEVGLTQNSDHFMYTRYLHSQPKLFNGIVQEVWKLLSAVYAHEVWKLLRLQLKSVVSVWHLGLTQKIHNNACQQKTGVRVYLSMRY